MIQHKDTDTTGVPKRLTLSAQNVPPELWDMAQAFIAAYPNMKGRGDLVRSAVESFIALALEFGLDGSWHPQIPGVQADIYKNAHDKLLGEKDKKEYTT